MEVNSEDFFAAFAVEGCLEVPILASNCLEGCFISKYNSVN